MPENESRESAEAIELLYPFYLDADMSMAFAAALAGGVALEREDVERDTQESQAVRNLRGNLRLFGALGAEAGRDTRETDTAATESRFVRRHTEASIFITLYDELRRRGQIENRVDMERSEPGSIVALKLGPAIAPLRRVVDQLLRLLDLAAPVMEAQSRGGNPAEGGAGREQQRKQPAGGAARKAAKVESDEERALNALRALLLALQEDLDRSGMVDLVVARTDAPSVVLTLDKRFLSEQALELIHTSSFVVVGKVTHVWPKDDEFVNLMRRSVMSLVPALAQTVVWNMFGLLAVLAASAKPGEAQKAVAALAGLPPLEAPEESSEVTLGFDVQALTPAIQGPAFQVLPLAICA